MDSSEFADQLGALLARFGPLPDWQLHLASRSLVPAAPTYEQMLAVLHEYEHTRFERRTHRRRRNGRNVRLERWALTAAAGLFVPGLDEAGPREPLPDPGLGLWAWQQEALVAWEQAGRRGAIEAVTGAGKTRLGLAAAYERLLELDQVTVIVPRALLVEQWASQVRALLPGVEVAERRAGSRGSAEAAVLVSTAQSAIRDPAILARDGLLIADECHRYGAEGFAQALLPKCRSRLALSATYSRLDDGVARNLAPYFGPVCFRYSYERAVPEGVVAPFKVAVIRVKLSEQERSRYEEAREAASTFRTELIEHHGAPRSPFGEFIATVSRWAEGPTIERHTEAARSYLKAFSDVRDALASAEAKRDVVRRLAPLIDEAKGALIFTQRISAAEELCETLIEQGIVARTLHSQQPESERNRVFDRFRQGRLRALIGVQVLDEGIDVPDADLAIVTAGTTVERQMIQRMGRVIRRKTDQRLARFVLLVAANTTEDPLEGGHEGFLDRITNVAVELRTFSANQASDAVAFLASTSLPDSYHACLRTLKDATETELDLLQQMLDAGRIDPQNPGYRIPRSRLPSTVDGLIGLEGVELGDGEQVVVPGSLLSDVARFASMLRSGRAHSQG